MSEPVAAEPARLPRLLSLDALRGFNMFWIIGGGDLFAELAKLANWAWLNEVSANLTDHVEWEGFHFHDMIFPLFLFIMGVSLPFAMAKRQSDGAAKAPILRKIAVRTLGLFTLGLIYNGLLDFEAFRDLRIMGVLQRLALGYGAAAALSVFLKPRQLAVAGAGLLILYAALLRWIPVPGFPLGDYTAMGSVASYVDRLVLAPGQLYKEYGDPEGLLSTIPAVTTCIIGILAGYWLRCTSDSKVKTVRLIAAGALLIAIGYAWSPWLPVIKKIWSSSYVLVAGGWSLIALAAFYWVIDVKGKVKWAAWFVVIGLNPITIYMMQRFVDFDEIAKGVVGGLLAHVSVAVEPVLFAAAVLGLKWLLLGFLHRQKVYLRV